MLITRKTKYTIPIIKLNNNMIELKKEMKYLGLVIDSKLNWRSHINYVYDKALKLTIKLSLIARNKWCLSSKSLKTIYKGAVLALISYCTPIWYESLEKKCN